MSEHSENSYVPDPYDISTRNGDNALPFLPDDEAYRISLSVFEGPIDLLLYLIRKKELDIHEISLSEILREYLEYVDLIKLIDIERAGEFIVVASTLMKIKARSLFAGNESGDEEGLDDDPRKALIRYLMEYEKLGGVTEKLAEKEESRRGIFPRGGEKTRIEKHVEEREAAPDYELFDLLSALRDVLKTAPKQASHEVALLNITSQQKQREILDVLDRTEKIDFLDFVANQPKIIIVVTFIAILELMKKRKIRVRQSGQFKRIVITVRNDAIDPVGESDDDQGTENHKVEDSE